MKKKLAGYWKRHIVQKRIALCILIVPVTVAATIIHLVDAVISGAKAAWEAWSYAWDGYIKDVMDMW